MSPARLHRDRAAQAATSPTPIAANVEGGQPAPAPISGHVPSVTHPAAMTPAGTHRLTQAVLASETDPGAMLAVGIDPVTATVRLRLQHDLRRLKEIQSIQLKIAAKREMLPEYRDWIDGMLRIAREEGVAVADEVLPVIMIWSIDTGDWPRALELAAHVLRHRLPLPARYERSAPALIVEEIADVAIREQNAGRTFPLDVLEEVELLTDGDDMHDEIRAKLMKAIGVELMRAADDAAPGSTEQRDAALRALDPLRRAQTLHDRVGAKGSIKRLEKIAVAAPAAPAAPTVPAVPKTD